MAESIHRDNNLTLWFKGSDGEDLVDDDDDDLEDDDDDEEDSDDEEIEIPPDPAHEARMAALRAENEQWVLFHSFQWQSKTFLQLSLHCPFKNTVTKKYQLLKYLKKSLQGKDILIMWGKFQNFFWSE